MFELRLLCRNAQQEPIIRTGVRLFEADLVTPAVIFDLFNHPASNLLATDNSGYVVFRVETLRMLYFRVGDEPLFLLFDPPDASPQPPSNVVLTTYLTAPVAEGITAGHTVAIDGDGLLYKGRADYTQGRSVIGFAEQSGNIEQLINVRSDQYFEHPAWNLITGRAIYLGLNGEITQNPVGLNVLQQLGTAVSPTRVHIVVSPLIMRG